MQADTLSLLPIFKNMTISWMITWMKNGNNFQIPKVQPEGVCLAFA